MDKTADYRTQSVVRELRSTETDVSPETMAWPLWLKSWFFIISSVLLWAGIYLAVSHIV